MSANRDDITADREWLVNQIAHALRNPIFAATVQTEALQLRAHDPAGVIKTVESLHGQLQRLSTCVDEMLLFGRPIRSSPEPISVAEVLSSLVTRYRNGDRQDPAEVSADPVEPDLTAHWDRNVVAVIFERLLDNAVQHTEAPHEIRISTVEEPIGTVTITISDQGAGIAPDILERALLPFFPQHSGRPGLGLAIAEKFARFLGGRIEIESVQGAGTVARCVLPLRVDSSAAR
jgi:two-component system sensor histidine kinase HydH